MPVVQAHRRLREDDCQFEASIDDTRRPMTRCQYVVHQPSHFTAFSALLLHCSCLESISSRKERSWAKSILPELTL